MSIEFGFVSSQVIKELEEIGNWKVSHLVYMQHVISAHIAKLR